MLTGMFTPPPQSLSTAHILHCFGRIHAHQGEQDLRSGRVKLKGVRPALQGQEIYGEVALAEAPHRHYEVNVYHTPEEEWVLSGDCTCAAGSDCQHCAALVYAWLRIQPAPVANRLGVERWLKSLVDAESHDPATAKPPQPALSQWIYLLDRAPQGQGLILKVGLQERANPQKPWRSTQYFAIQALWPPSARPQAPILNETREIFQMLWSFAQHADPRIPHPGILLQGKLAWPVLQDILATSCCFWKHPPAYHQQGALHLGASRKATPFWKEVPGGQQWQAQLQPPLTPLEADPLPPLFILGPHVLYYDSQSQAFGPVSISAARMRQWLNAPVIADSDLLRVRDQLVAQLPLPSALPKGYEIPVHHLTQKPSAILDLYHAERVELSFDYGELQLPGSPASAQTARYTRVHKEKQCLYHLERDIAEEQRLYQLLLSTGLLPVEPQAARFAFGIPEYNTDMFLANQWHYWLHHHLPSLKAQAWQVHIHEAFRLQFIASSAWQGELLPAPEQDSFELSLGINLNGETVNLLPLLLRLLRTTPELSAMREQLESREIWILPLDPDPLMDWAARAEHRKLPQRWLEIPTRRLIRILDILIDLYDERTPEAALSLNVSYFEALQLKTQLHMNPDDYGVQWQAPPGFEPLIKALLNPRPQDLSMPGLQAELRPYQSRGVHWLQTLASARLNGILADDMGLGKTLQTLTLLQQAKHQHDLNAPALIVMPTSVLSTWEQEAARFTPDLKVLRYHGPERQQTSPDFKSYDVILTTYALFRQDVLLHRQHTYSWLILDEAQYIKNPRARTALAACAQPSQHRLCLTGTPLENNLENLWSLFHFLMPGFLGSLEHFNRHFRLPIEKTQDTARLQVLRERIQPFVLRRLKQEVVPELPPKTEILRTIPLGNAQRDLYETLRLSVDKDVQKAIATQGFQQSRLFILEALLKLRQACCDPRLLPLPEAQKMRQSAKLEHLMLLLPELLSSGRRVLIFSQFVSMLRLIEERLHHRQISYALLTGATRQRDAEIARFQQGEVPVFLISLKAGGVGLNLPQADTVIHYDPWWNPASEQQATDRSWRIGQTQPVFVYRLIAQGTVEEHILHLQQQKQSLQQGLLSQGPLALEQWELLSLLQSPSL